MHPIRPAHAAPPLASQRGAALLVTLFIVVLAGLGLLAGRLGGISPVARDSATSAALAEARRALLAYAATYSETYPGQMLGFLPCPDTDNDGSANPPCGIGGQTVAGRLPWRQLGLPPLRDGDGECLWYAVSGSFKNNPKPALLNWDSAGGLRVVDARGGAALVDADDLAGADGGAAAVIFAPGPPLAGQNRPSGNKPCSGDGSNSFAAYIESVSFPSTARVTVTQGKRGDSTVNDRLTWLTPRDIFDHIRQRTDFIAQINLFLGQTAAKLSAYATLPIPTTAVPLGLKQVGEVASASLDNTALYKEWQQTWNDQIRYLVCSPAAACLTVNGTACRGALVFSGERNGGGPRTSSQKMDPASYFAGDILGALTGSASVDASAPTADLAICL